jgi:hypothetical protein
MALLDILFERKQKKENIEALDVKNLDANDGDSIVISNAGQMNNVNFYQYERGQTETAKIETYRQIAKTAEIDEVISDITNETFIFQTDKRAFELDWRINCNISDQLKDKIYNEFCNLYAISNFDDIGMDLLQSFYIDGRIVFQKIVDSKNLKRGIRHIVKLDPLNVVKVKIVPDRDRKTQMIKTSDIKEFYVYSNKKINNQKSYLNNIYNYNDDIVEGIKLENDSISYVTSGLTDSVNDMTIGHLDKAIIPYNNLKMMEQSMVIFRVVRAPMRRAFYVDVSSLPKNRAEQYMKSMATQFKSKLNYNADTGSWVDKKSIINMLEDYFIPRFNESKTTEIQNIEGQSSQEILDEVNYMQDKLYQALNAPKSRYSDDGNVFVYGKSDQIQRDEYRFKKFLDRVRNRFMLVFDDFLKTQLILKEIISESDWDEIKRSYFWRFTEDNAFIEYKDAEILNTRINTVVAMADLIEKGYYSKQWIRKNILRQTDEEIEQIDIEVFKELNQDPNKSPENYKSASNNDSGEQESELDDETDETDETDENNEEDA